MATVMRGRTTIVIAHRPGHHRPGRPRRAARRRAGRGARARHDELLATSAATARCSPRGGRDEDEADDDGDHVPSVDDADADVAFERELLHEVDDAGGLATSDERGAA